MMGNRRPLEFYLREQSRLPGQRANLELMNDLSHLLAVLTQEQPDNVRALLHHLIHHHYKGVDSNTPDEFVMLCGVVSFGACAAVRPEWRGETIEFLNDCARSSSWRLKSRPGSDIRQASSSNSENVNRAGSLRTTTSRRPRSSRTGPALSSSPPSARGPVRRSTARILLRSSASPNGLVT